VPDGGPDAPDATPAGLREENARPNPTVVVAIDEWLWPLSVTRWDPGCAPQPDLSPEAPRNPVTLLEAPQASVRTRRLDDQFLGMPAGGEEWAAAETAAGQSGGGLPALVVEVAAGGQASGSTSGCVKRTGLPSDRA
jgi:hypothetical protein